MSKNSKRTYRQVDALISLYLDDNLIKRTRYFPDIILALFSTSTSKPMVSCTTKMVLSVVELNVSGYTAHHQR